MMEAWDGPSALVFTDGFRRVGAMLDRNALRPGRYSLSREGLLVFASESGVSLAREEADSVPGAQRRQLARAACSWPTLSSTACSPTPN